MGLGKYTILITISSNLYSKFTANAQVHKDNLELFWILNQSFLFEIRRK